MKARTLVPIAGAAIAVLAGLWLLFLRGSSESREELVGGAAAPAPESDGIRLPDPEPRVDESGFGSRTPAGLDPEAREGVEPDEIFSKSPVRPQPDEMEGPLARVFYEDGTPCFEGQQRLDSQGNWVLHGRWTAWHENGQVQEQGWYENHREAGDWQWWDEEGNPIAVGTFIDGRREGAWNFWHANGFKQLDARYEKGEGSGFWTLYFEDGQKCAEGHYVDGEIEGYWTIWDEFGEVNPDRSGRYEKGKKVSD